MVGADPANPSWYRALTLDERAEGLGSSPVREHPADDVDAALARRRLERWRAIPAFRGEGSCFARRLARANLTQEGLLGLLGEPAEAVRDRLAAEPDWLVEIDRAFSEPTSPDTLSSLEGFPAGDPRRFLCVVAPLISAGRRRMREALEALLTDGGYPLPFGAAETEEVLFASLPDELVMRLSRTMILELNVARLQGHLSGPTPEERFESFIQRLLRRDVALAILQEYPVLARKLTECIDRWLRVNLEFLRRLGEDWGRIAETFDLDDVPASLTRLETGEGDKHDDGRSVCIATFDTGLRLVYKPRSLGVEARFQGLLAWLNERGNLPPFRELKVLDRGSHGWVEYVAAEGCASKAALGRFYRRQGGYLAVLYALHATDFHHENVIASGEHPVLVDLEALFHAHGRDVRAAHDAPSVMLNLEYSVLDTGMLPRRIGADAEQGGIDLSGLGGGQDRQVSPDGLPSWRATGTDEMKIGRGQIEWPTSNNRPALHGEEVDLTLYAEDVVSGFAEAYRSLVRHRDELLCEDGPLAGFADARVRHIVRATRTYGMFLQESFHPDLLRDALDRDRFFDNLWAGGEADARLARLYPHEMRALHREDIPLFSRRPGSRHLWGTSNQRLDDHFPETALSPVYERIRNLGDEDMARQTALIRASFTANALGKGPARWPRFAFALPRQGARGEELRDGARKIGDKLATLSLKIGQGVSWLTLEPTNEKTWSLVPMREGLYDGLSGVALFLGYLGAVTGEGRYGALAGDAVKTILGNWRLPELAERSPHLTVGAFGDLGGTIYALSHLGALWNRPDLLDEAERLVELLPPLIANDRHYGLLNGAAGCIEVLSCLHHVRPSQRNLALAGQCGDHLVAGGRPEGGGIGWPQANARRPLAGYAHGAAGISSALLGLADLTGDQTYKTAALGGIAYERGLFCAERGNWPDLRETHAQTESATAEDGGRFMVGWCHGAPGIGLGRLGMLGRLGDPVLTSEVRAATGTTLREGLGLNHSLCHGSLGNIELLLEASRVLGDRQLGSRTYEAAAGVLRSVRRHGWLCGVPTGAEIPDLMSGLAGIGYGLLRLADPERVPSVLALDPPRERDR